MNRASRLWRVVQGDRDSESAGAARPVGDIGPVPDERLFKCHDGLRKIGVAPSPRMHGLRLCQPEPFGDLGRSAQLVHVEPPTHGRYPCLLAYSLPRTIASPRLRASAANHGRAATMDDRTQELERRVEALEDRLERLIRLVGASGGIMRGGVDDMLSEETP